MGGFEQQFGQPLEHIEPLSEVTSDEFVFIQEGNANKEWNELQDIRMSEEDKIKLEKINQKIGRIEGIRRAADFGELFRALQSAGPIQGSEKIFQPEELIEIIEAVRAGNKDVKLVTRTINLRQTVLQLLASEILNRPSPESPEGFPPGSQIISEGDWQHLSDGYPASSAEVSFLRDYRARSHNNYPQVGSKGHGTRFGAINGPLVWCDGKFAIFDTPQGKIRVPFMELMAPEGKTYAEREEEWKKEQEDRRRRQAKPPLKRSL